MNFKDFFIEKTKNPLRKQSLRNSGRISNKEMLERDKKKLSGSDYKKIRNLKKVGEDEFADKFKKQKIQSRERKLKGDYLTDKVTKNEFTKVADVDGFEFFVRNDDEKLHQPSIQRLLKIRIPYAIKEFNKLAKGIIPIKGKPKFVIEDTKKHFEASRGYLKDRIIHLDWKNASDAKTILHEYAHYLTSKIPAVDINLIQTEYKKLLDNYFKSVKKRMRDDLQDASEGELLHLRKRIAKKIGLPDPYGMTNPDEFFAVMIEHWKDLPNNRQTYKLKNIVKRVISRL